ncbi:ATP-binding protein, partial [bacterium]|nr:ATP-binding protein [bacterium]
MNNYTITPEVDQTQEFIEIANDFSNPLDVVREAISNAYDAKATTISILFDVVKEYGIDILRVRLIDNGHGMDKDGLKSFFDLGNSLRRDDKSKIGEKGHGTKVFFNCKRIEVITINDKMKYIATMHDPMVKLYERILPEIQVEVEENIMDENGTHISI